MQAVSKPHLVRRQSALMLKCSDTEPVVQSLRERLDPSAADGVSAHLNLLYPFTTNLSMGDDDALIEVLRDFGRFHIDFTRTGWFGTDSVYLVPDNTTVLTNLVTRIREVFPEYPAFGAVPERAVPHVTMPQPRSCGPRRPKCLRSSRSARSAPPSSCGVVPRPAQAAGSGIAPTSWGSE